MKIYIEFSDSKNPWGGGNQFLGNLKKYLIKKKAYTSNANNADIILINSFENFRKVISLKKEFPNKKFIQRVNGITQLYNNIFDKRDLLTFFLNQHVSIGTIFQSKWCEKKNKKYGLEKKKFEKIILNTPDEKIFFEKKSKLSNKIISSGWSNNINKGFEILSWLDKNLDFKKFSYSYIGNSPIRFSNIKMNKPLKSKELSRELRKHDIYISASQNDACSNSIIEAKYCGLKILALNQGGNPELLNKKFLYNNKYELLKKINLIISKKNKNYFKKSDSRKEYYKFFKIIYNSKVSPTKLSMMNLVKMYLVMLNVLLSSYISKILTIVKKFYIFKLKLKYF